MREEVLMKLVFIEGVLPRRKQGGVGQGERRVDLA